jgi:hypothetical protein
MSKMLQLLVVGVQVCLDVRPDIRPEVTQNWIMIIGRQLKPLASWLTIVMKTR